MQNAAQRIASLDGLRVVAALAVVGFHFLWREPTVSGSPEMAASLAMAGYLGVNLFFLISGFVIAMSAEGRNAQSFAAARFARIYPGFVACMLLSFCILAIAGDERFPVTVPQALANLAVAAPLLGQPFIDGVYWSIVVELLFYGWVAVAILTGLFERGRLWLVAGWLAVSFVNEFWLGSAALRFVFLTEYAGLFAAGMLLWQVRREGWNGETALLLGASFMLSSATMGITRDWMLEHYGSALGNGELLIANAAIHGLFVSALALRVPSGIAAPLAVAGALTYPLYLLHQNIGAVVVAAVAPTLGFTAGLIVALAVAVSLSWLVWCFVETPLLGPVRRLAAAALDRALDPLQRRRGAVADAPSAH